jgi:hypothetical protein
MKNPTENGFAMLLERGPKARRRDSCSQANREDPADRRACNEVEHFAQLSSGTLFESLKQEGSV